MGVVPITVESMQQQLWSFGIHRIITVAGRTGILRKLALGAISVEDLASTLDLDLRATGKVVRALSALGWARAEGEEYRLADALIPVFTPGPNDLTPFLMHAHHLYESWGENLEPWLRGQPWKSMIRNQNGLEQFGQAMAAMAGIVAAQLVGVLELKGVTRVLDVGGGIGAYARALCRAEPKLSVDVLDTEEVAVIGRAAFAEDPLVNRIRFIGGDYRSTDPGTGYDLVLFANVLHQEDETEAAAMIERGAWALAPNGRVAVLDFAIDDGQRENLVGALFAINMRSFGDTYTEPTITRWLSAAGLVDITRQDLDRTRWLITGKKKG